MKSFIKNLSFKKVLYALLTFVMALCLIFCSLATVMSVTVFNKDYMTDTLNSSEYYKDLCNELTEKLTDLGDASGLKKSFFEKFVDEILVSENVQAYINNFYDGKQLKVNTSKFDEELQTALKKYIKENDIEAVNEESLNYFSAKASKIYADTVKIKYLSSIQDLILNNKGKLTVVIIVLLLIIAAIVCVLIFTNEWKHKALRYIYTAVSSAGLFLFTLSVGIFASGTISHIAIISRSLSDMYTSIINSVLSDIIVVSLVLFAIGLAIWVIHGRIRKKATI